MKTAIIVLLALLSANILHAQRGFADGYIVTLKGDTIKCKVKDRTAGTPGRKIKCMAADNKKVKYIAKDIAGYGKLGLVHYRSIPMALGIMRFAELIEDGNICLYKYMTKHTSTNYYGGGGYGYGGYGTTHTTTTSIKIEYYLQRKGSATVDRVPHIGFRDLVMSYVKDNADLVRMVDDKSLRYEDIQLIIRKYNTGK